MIVAALSMLLAGCGQNPENPPEETQSESGYASASLPSTPPAVLPATLTVRKTSKTYVITGIGLGGTNKVAIINNKVIKPGAEIDTGVVLRDVQPTYAVIRSGNKDYLLRPEDIQRELDKK